jgi:uncharacterized protein involved in outer membrane biogenesis
MAPGAALSSLPRPARWALGALVALPVVLYLVLLFFPWNTLREPIANYYTAKTGRKVVIAGDLTVKLAWHPWIDVRGIAIANAPWSDQPVMASVERLGMRVEPLSYFTRLRIPEIELQGPRAILERNADGAANWVMGDSVASDDTTDAGDLPLIGRVRVGDAHLRYRDADPRVRLDVSGIALTATDRQGQESLIFSGDGSLRGARFTIAGQGEGLGTLREPDAPFSLVFSAKNGATQMWFDGEVVPASPENVRGFIKIAGQDMSQLYPLLPAPVPWTPPYQVNGDVTRLPDRWKVTSLAGKVGRSDVTGQVEILTNTPRRKFVADIVSARLDYRDLGGFVGLPAGASAAKRSPEQKAEAAKLARQDRVFSDDRFELDRLRDYDAHFRFRGKAVRVDEVPMEIVEMNILLERGVLRYDPVKVGIADGTLTLVGSIDANAKAPRLDMRLEGRNLDLARIYPELASPRGRAGRFGGYVKVKAQGSSVRGMTQSADGEGALIMSGGEASALALLLTNLDLAGAVPLIVGGDQTAALYCAVSAFGINNGLVRPRLMVIDTSRVRIDGEGTIDLAHEKYALVLKAKSKQFSIFALRGPIVIGGSLRDPTVAPSVAPIAARVGVAAGLATVSPPLAILPFIDVGGTPDIDCRRVLGASDNASVPLKDEARAERDALADRSPRPAPARGS